MSLATPQFHPNSKSHKIKISIDNPKTRDRVARYCIFQSEVIFEKLKVTKLKKDLLDNLRVEIKDIRATENIH